MSKLSLLLITLLVFPSLSFSQYSRSFYTTDPGIKLNSTIAEVNGEMYFVSVRESLSDTLRLEIGKIDENGETSDYRSIEYPSFIFESNGMFISGVAVDDDGDIILALLAQESTICKVKYVEIDLTTNTVISTFTLLDEYKRGNARSRVNGDSLVTYIGTDAGAIDRISTAINDISTGSIETVSNTITYSGSFTNTRKMVELTVDAGREYAVIADNLIKRDGVGAYSFQTINGFIIHPPSIVINGNDEIVVFKGPAYTVLDQGLVELSTGAFSFLTNISNGFEAYNYNGAYRVLNTNNFGQIEVFDVDVAFTDVLSKTLYADKVFGTYTNANGTYIVGERTENNLSIGSFGIPFLSNAVSCCVILDDGQSTMDDFIEYRQELAHEDIYFNVNHLGRSFNDTDQNVAGFGIEKNGERKSLIYTNGTSFTGQNSSNELKGYFNHFSSILSPGPYTTQTDYSNEVLDKYNRGYYVTVDMIEDHITNSVNNTPGYVMPFGIREWPVSGDIALGQASDLASYEDRNGNGVYDPENGDYPKIYGDQCLLNIYHQSGSAATSSQVECHQYYFTIDCDTSETLKNTVFMRQNYFLRGDDLDSVYVTQFSDFDLGNFADDYNGTNVELGLAYAYNGDAFDETSGGNAGFNDTIPAVGMMYLQGVKLDENGADNPIGVAAGESINGFGFGDGINDNEFYTLEASLIVTNTAVFGFYPTDVQGNYNLAKGLYPSGLPKQVAGVDVRYDYFGNSDPLFYGSNGVDHGNNYSEITVPNPTGDRRIYGASGPANVSTTDTLEIITVFTYGLDTVNLGVQNSVDKLFSQCVELRDYYSQGTLGCGQSFDTYFSNNTAALNEIEIPKIRLYPNPTQSTIQIVGLSGNSSIQILDLNGTVVQEENTQSQGGVELDLSKLSNAVYIVVIRDDYGVRTTRLVKQ